MNGELDLVQPGDRVGPYRIVRGFQGRGGMARVFEVEVREKYRQPGMPRRLALKVAREQHQAALAAEADFLSRFDHPNVVRIFPLPRGDHHRPVYAARERFSFGWGWYYAMELINGGCLHEHLTRPTAVMDLLRWPSSRQRRLSALETLGIVRQLTVALEHIHEKHVINLDVKPGNVLFRRQSFRYLRGSVPQAVLCDFGIARDLRYPRTGQLGIATPEYVSPEQALESSRAHWPVDVRSDIFSLGIVMYEMLTGQLPFENAGMVADPNCFPVAPRELRRSISPALAEIAMRALAKNPDWRFQTATEIRVALEQLHTPLDWRAVTRRTFLGVALAASVVAGSRRLAEWGGFSMPTDTPKPPLIETVTHTPTATFRPTSTAMPTGTPQVPTSTPAPTATPMPSFTPTPSSTFAPTPSPILTTPELVAPARGSTHSNPIVFQWSGSLSAGQVYQVTARHVKTGYRTLSESLTVPHWTTELPYKRWGEWKWSVSVIQDAKSAATSPEWHFWLK